MMATRPGTLCRASTSAAPVPRIVASIAVAVATDSERILALHHVGEWRYTWYHRNDSPCGGKLINEPAVNDTGMTKNVGTSMNVSTSTAAKTRRVRGIDFRGRLGSIPDSRARVAPIASLALPRAATTFMLTSMASHEAVPGRPEWRAVRLPLSPESVATPSRRS